MKQSFTGDVFFKRVCWQKLEIPQTCVTFGTNVCIPLPEIRFFYWKKMMPNTKRIVHTRRRRHRSCLLFIKKITVFRHAQYFVMLKLEFVNNSELFCRIRELGKRKVR